MPGAMSSGESILLFQYCDFAGNIELDEGEYLIAGYMPCDNADDQLHLTDGIDRKVASSGYAISTNSTEEEIQAACMLLNYILSFQSVSSFYSE